VLLLAAVVSIHKPLLSGVYDVTPSYDDGTTAETPANPAAGAGGGFTPVTDVMPGQSASERDAAAVVDQSWLPSIADVAAGNSNDVLGAAAMLVTSSSGDRHVCGRNPDYWKSSFVAEIIYGLSITVVPFVPIIAAAYR